MPENIRDDTLHYEAPLHKLFEMQALLHPEHTALTCGKRHLTYSELNKRANQLAHLLRLKGVGIDTFVGIALSRNIELIVAILGVLKAGAAYVPLDPSYPKERLELMLLDCKPTVVVTEEEQLAKIPDTSVPLLCLDTDIELNHQSIDNPKIEISLENIAYVIYTSGSTGTPKGCLTEHRNVTRLWTESQKLFSFTASDVWTLFHSYAFDFSVWEIWGALLHGGGSL
jgi:fengycin family lipopeptide synthetase B